MFLLIMGHNGRNRVIQERFQHSGETVSRYFNKVLRAMVIWSPEMIKPSQQFTTPPEILRSSNFYPFFKDCIGALDGTHIPTMVPLEDQPRYRNRKGIISQNVLAICTFDMIFTNVYAGWKGTTADSRVLNAVLDDRNQTFPRAPIGLFDEMLLFCFGVCLGVMSIVLSNKTKLDKLNESLKQTKNLVQDLQEELEMKDRMTVKELVNDACQFQECNDHFFDIEELDRSYQYDDKELQVQKSRDNSESMSKIEAELEAELERLELNINTSTLERRLSGLSELDPDLIADVVHGELRADVVNGRAEDQANSEPDVSSTPHTSNYAVSPRELSLRLHQLLQSRLEERIAELETSLQQSHARIQSLESGPLHSRKRFTNGNKGSSDQESPTRLDFQQLQLSDEDEGNTLVHPLYLNLSGDAIDSYNEAYREFIRMAEIEENLTSTGDPYVQGLYQKHVFAGENGSLIHNEVMHFVREKTKTWEKNLRSRGSNEGSDRDNEDDEEGKLLIKHIVEKTRKGSPVVQNAHRRFLLSMD